MSSLDFSTGSASHRNLSVRVQTRMLLAGLISVEARLSLLSTVVASTSWHRLWLRGSIPRTGLPYIRARYTPFSIVTARCDTRIWS